jgi:hypothetical protein
MLDGKSGPMRPRGHPAPTVLAGAHRHDTWEDVYPLLDWSNGGCAIALLATFNAERFIAGCVEHPLHQASGMWVKRDSTTGSMSKAL